jgi:hypothetical protein
MLDPGRNKHRPWVQYLRIHFDVKSPLLILTGHQIRACGSNGEMRVTQPSGCNEIAECQPTSAKRFCSLLPEGVEIVIFALILVLLPNRYTNRPEQLPVLLGPQRD